MLDDNGKARPVDERPGCRWLEGKGWQWKGRGKVLLCSSRASGVGWAMVSSAPSTWTVDAHRRRLSTTVRMGDVQVH